MIFSDNSFIKKRGLLLLSKWKRILNAKISFLLNNALNKKSWILFRSVILIIVVVSGSLFYIAKYLPQQSAKAASWYSSSWLYRKAITIDNSKVSGQSDLSNFPVLISLSSDSNIASNALSSGNDILFTSSDGVTKLNHEIEKYTSGTGELIAWVKVPTLATYTDTVLYIYYGNSGAANQQNAAGVWDTNYKNVYHFAQTPTGSAGDITDSTGTSNGTSVNMEAGDQGSTGKVDGALTFDGTNEYVNSNTNTNYSSVTYEFWLNSTSRGGGTFGRLFDKNQGSGFSSGILWDDWPGQTDVLSFERAYSTTNGAWYVSGQTGLGTLKHFVVTYTDGVTNTPSIYINGVAQTVTVASGQTPAGTVVNNTDNYIFGNRGAVDRGWDGVIDEVRISNSIRSADWIATTYDNENSPSTFFTIGTQQSYGTVVLSQSTYRFLTNADSITPGAGLVAANTPYYASSATAAFRLRMNIQADAASLSTSGQSFKLQYVERGLGTCSSPTGTSPASYTDITTSTEVAYNDNASVSDGANISSTANDPPDGSRTLRYQTYEELNNFTNSQNSIGDGQSGQWDFSLKLNNITTSKVYCIRAVKSDGTVFDTYSYYPQVARIITPASAWYSNSWLYRKKITIPYTQITGGANLTNFPVLISLTNTELKNNALATGYDILFTSSDNATKLDHEIESYDPTTGTLVAWVRIPTLSYTANTDIYMYFGNPVASNQQNRTGVWNSNYKLVMHMNENPNSTADGACGGGTKELCDSTSNANDGDSNGTTLSRVTGQIGGALGLGGSNEYISLPTSSSLNYSTYTGLSLTMWVKPQTLPSAANVTMMSSWSNTTSQRPFHIRMNSANTKFSCQTSNGNGSRNSVSNYAANTWFQLGCILTLSTSLQAEVNGSLEASDTSVNATLPTNSLATIIGALQTTTQSQFYNGLIDEVRIYNGVLTAGWLDAEYKNQNSPSTFTTFATTQDQNLTPILGQGSYRFFANANSTDVGSALAAQNTDVTISGSSTFRLRANVTVDSTSYSTSGLTLKLQYANKGTGSCSSPQYSYADVTTSTTIAYNDNATPTDGSNLTSNANDPTESGRTLRKQTYEELNNFTNSTVAIGDGEAAMWDFSLKDNGGSVGASYCFRIVQSTGTVLTTYTYYPQVTIHPFVQSNYSIATGTVSSRAVSFSSSVTTGNLIVVLVNTWSSSGIQTATVTDNKGNTYSTATSQGVDHGGGNVDWSGIFYVTNATGGSSFTVTATPTNAPQQVAISIHEYSGLNALDKTSVNYGSGTSGTPGSVTPVTSPELYFGGIDFNSGTTGDTTTLPAGYTLRTNYPDTSNNPSNITYDALLTSTSAVNPTATFSTSQDWISAGTTFYYATDPVYTQQAYRFFSNANSADVGAALNVTNSAVATNSTTTAFRLRTIVRVDVLGVSTSGLTLKLQFALKGNGTCSSPDNAYSDVTTSTAIAYNDNATPTDGSALTSNANDPTDSSRTIRKQTYEELNNFTNSQAAIAAGEDGMWDFSLKPNGVSLGQTYCFRIVKSDNTTLSYVNYPTYVFDILIQGASVESVVNASITEQISFSSSVTTGNAIILFVHTRFRSVSPSVNVTDNKGNTYSLAVSRLATNFNGSNPDVVMIFYSLNVTGGSGFTIDIKASDNSTALYISAFAGEYTNIVSFDQNNSNRATASSATAGSITTTYANELIFFGFANDSGNSTTQPTGYNERFDVTEYTGHISAAVSDNTLSSTATINPSATLSGSSDFIAAIASFQMASTGSLDAKFVDSGGTEIPSPSLSFGTTGASVDCQTATGTMGTSGQKLRITNTTGSPSWSLSIAALSGETSQWTTGTDNYDYNDPTGSGCTDGADADSNAGQLSINPSAGTSTPQSGCTNTGVSLGSSSAYSEGTVSSIGLISTSGSAGTGCYWDVTGIGLSQTIPPTKSGTYSLNLSITLVAT